MAETSLVFNILARDKASSTFDKLKGKAALLAGAVAVMAVKFGKDSVSAFVEAETAQAKLSAAFDKFPGLADTNIGRLNKLNTSLAQKTRFDDDATASGQSVLAQFKLTGSQIERLTPLMQDYAAKTGKDLPTAAQDLGKAVLGQGRALKAIGVNFTDTGSAAGNLAAVQQALNEKVGGFAAREGKTAAGQAEILRNQFGELQEQAGSKLVPSLVKLAGVLLDVIGFVQRNASVIVPLVGVFGTAAAVIYTVITAQKIWTATQAAFNVVMTANPIGLVIAAIALLVGGFILAYKNSETFRNVVDGALRNVAEAGRWMWEVLKSAFGSLKIAFGAVGDVGTFMWEVLKSAFGSVKTGLGAVGDAGTFMWEVIKSAFGSVKTAFGAVGDAGTFMWEVLKSAFGSVKTGFGAVGDAGNFMWDVLKSAFSSVKTAFGAVGDAGTFMWDVLKKAFIFVTDAWLTVAGVILDGAVKAFGWIPGIGDKLRGAQEKFQEFRDSVNAALDGVKDGVTVTTRITGGQAAIDEIGRLRYQISQIPRSVTVGVLNKVQNIPAYAHGTLNHPGGMALVGERGPELVSLPRNSAVYTAGETRQMMGAPMVGGGAGATTNVYLNVSAIDGPGAATAVKGLLDDYVRRNGPLRGLTA